MIILLTVCSLFVSLLDFGYWKTMLWISTKEIKAKIMKNDDDNMHEPTEPTERC